MVVPYEKENSKMETDKNRSALRDILRDNLYMCEQSILKSRKILENITEKSDMEKHQEEILKLLGRMKTNVLHFETKCNSIDIDKKAQLKPFKFRKRSVLSLKRSNNDSTEETDVELVGSSMHNNSPSKESSNKKQNETNGLAKVETKRTNLPQRSNIENVPVDPIVMDITNDVEETSPNAENVCTLNPIVIIANDVTETQEQPVKTNGTCDRNSQRLARNSSICVEHAGSITVPSDDEDDESDEDPIPFSRFDAQEPPDEALDLEPSQNSLKIEDEPEVVTKQDTASQVDASEGEKNDNASEKENTNVEDGAGGIGTEGKDDIDLLVDFPSSSQEKEDLLQLLTDKEKQDARDVLDVETALKELSDEDSSDSESDSDNTDLDAAVADCSMTESSDISSDDESDMSGDDEREVTKENDSEHHAADHDQNSEISSQESQDIQRFISTVKECSVSLQRFDQMSDDEIDRLCMLHNVSKRKCSFSPPLKRAKRVRKLSTTSASSDSSADSFPYDFQEDPTDLCDLLPGSPIPASELLDEVLCHDVSSLESSETETDLDSDTDMEKSQKKKNKTDDPKTSEEVKESDEIRTVNEDDVNETEEGETEDSDSAKKLDRWRNDPLLRERLWSDSEDKESDSQSAKGDAIIPKTEDDEETIAKNYKPKLRSFVIEDTDDEASLEDPTVISDSLSDSSDSDIEFVDEQNIDPSQSQSQPGRRNIRAVLTDEQLTFETQRAKKEEDERIERLEERSRTLSSIHSQRDELVLDYDLTNGLPQVVVDQGLRDHLKPHQIEGVKFMWEACFESVKMMKRSSGGGCILAHCMGLGKTLQVITLIHTLFMHERFTGMRHVLIVCPLSTVLNWKNEFKLASEKTYKDPNIKIHIMRSCNLNQKCEKVKEWRLQGGVIIMGYEAYEMLSNEKQARKVSHDSYEYLQRALVNPGPDLVVCDEGHLIKNGKTLRNKALMKITTKRRIILTGTPLQNNLTEYYYMVEFVKPRLLGTLQEYKNRFGDPIMNGQFHNSTPKDIKMMKKCNHVLTKLLKKTIQRVESSVLKSYLPEIMDYTLFVNLTPLQISHYKKYINMMKEEEKRQTSFFRDFQVTNYIGLHPYTLIRYNENSKKKKQKEQETIEYDDHPVDNITNVAPEWWRECTPEDVATKIEFGSKLAVVWAILEESLKLGDKVLIFSSSLVELDCLEHFLHMYGVRNTPWKRNADFFRMDGTVPPQTRSYLCNEFNNRDNKEIKAFLISHKVGGLGLNLIAANRVILLEANHNPSYDLQCVYRIFRFGQTKKCFVYRLISNGTMEEKVYRKCVVKLAVASTVVDKYHVKRHYSSGDLETMYAYDFEQFQTRPVPSVPKDKLLATLLQSHPVIHAYHEHQTLLENTPDEELNDEDKKLAWEEYNIEEMKKNAPPVPTSVTPQAVVNVVNRQNAAERNICMPYNFKSRQLLPKTTHNAIRAPPPPYGPPPVQHGSMHNVFPAPQMFPINLHNPVEAPALRLSNVAAPHYDINNYPQNSIDLRSQLNAPTRVGNRVSATTTYFPSVIQAAPARNQLPASSGTATYHYLPQVVQGPPARHRPPVTNRPVQSSSRLQINSTLEKEWLQRLTQVRAQNPAQHTGTRHAPVASHNEIQQFRNSYAKPSSNGTTFAGNIETIDLSTQPQSFNAQRDNVPSNQTNVPWNQVQGEFNYTLNKFQ